MSNSKTPESLLNRLDWTVLRRLEGLFQGEYRTLFRGTGLDLADLREYQPPDDVRHIDWNVTARLQRPYVRIFHEDRELTAWFLIDLSPSLDAGWAQTRKRDVAIELTAVLAQLVSRHGNRVASMLFGTGDTRVLSPGRGRAHVLHLIRRMTEHDTKDRIVGQTDLRAALITAARTIQRRSLVFLISDFVSSHDWAPTLGQLVMRHEVVACRIVDPLERSLPDIGVLTMQDAETGEQVFVDTTQARVRRAYEEAAKAEDASILEGLGESGVDCIEIGTQDDLVHALVQFARSRKTRAQAASAQEV
jgi:uncharacterized protein (DUF58 family)